MVSVQKRRALRVCQSHSQNGEDDGFTLGWGSSRSTCQPRKSKEEKEGCVVSQNIHRSPNPSNPEHDPMWKYGLYRSNQSSENEVTGGGCLIQSD